MFNSIMRKKKSVIAVASLLVVCVIIILCVALIPKTDKIEYEIFYDGIEGEGVVFRNEVFYDLSDYEKVYYENVVEGQKIEKNTIVASAYKKGYIKATLEKLFKTEQSIVTYQNQNIITGFDDKKIQQYDFEINVTIKQMSAHDGGYIELHNKLSELMTARQDYVRLTYNTESNEYLQGLYADEISMTESLRAWCDQMKASEDGYVGVYCDGHEAELTTEKAQTLSYEEYQDIFDGDYTNGSVGFKVVKDEKWYALVEIDDVSPFQVGNLYPVYINNESQNEAGYLENIINNKKGSVLVFSFEDNVEKYLDVRKAKLFIGNRIEGFCVDSDFIKNDVALIKKDKEKINIAVDVLYRNDEFVIFGVNSELSLGQKVYK